MKFKKVRKKTINQIKKYKQKNKRQKNSKDQVIRVKMILKIMLEI